MGQFERFRHLRAAIYAPDAGFKRWFIQLQRCYPWPEWLLAELLCTSLPKFWRLRNGRCKPNRRLMLMMGYFIVWRIGAVETTHDLLRVKKLMATGELERMIDECLAKEGKAELKRRAAEALKYARQRGELP